MFVIMGHAKSVEIEKRGKDRDLGDTSTLRGKGKKSSPPKNVAQIRLQRNQQIE